MKTEISTLDKVSEGVFLSNDTSSYEAYIKKMRMMEKLDNSEKSLQNKINIMDDRIQKLETIIQNLLKADK